jgi:hypothetical protein
VSVVAPLVLDVEEDEQAHRQPDSQPEDVERGIEPVFQQRAIGDQGVVLQHNFSGEKIRGWISTVSRSVRAEEWGG